MVGVAVGVGVVERLRRFFASALLAASRNSRSASRLDIFLGVCGVFHCGFMANLAGSFKQRKKYIVLYFFYIFSR